MQDTDTQEGRDFRSGYVSLTGKPNVGKSTFLNAVVGQKLAIVTSRPQTTRNRIMGIRNMPDAQIVFLDTPGIHRPKHGLGDHMVKEAWQAVHDVDLVALMVEPSMPGPEDRKILKFLRDAGKLAVLLINKSDTVKKTALLPVIQKYSESYDFKAVVPISALKGDGVDEALGIMRDLLPQGPRLFPEDMLTDVLERFIVAEIVREKVMALTHEEVPHAVAVEVKVWQEADKLITIGADIYIEKDGQKGIIIGNRGARIKEIGTASRKDIESLLGIRVYLELFVKVVPDWRRKRSVLTDLGYR